MDTVSILPWASLGGDFIPPDYIPQGKDQYYLRDLQQRRDPAEWRHLRADQIDRLVRNNNDAHDWDQILVTDDFEPDLIKNNEFFGLVRIGSVRKVTLEHHELRVPAGITNSRIASCDIGDDAAIHNIGCLAHYITGDRCILSDIDEMHTTNHSKFGNGIVKAGEPEDVRVWLDLMNETGCRRVLPFDGIITADAYLWARYRDDHGLQDRLKAITQAGFDSRRGFYGVIGDQCVIKSCRILKDVKIGSHCYIKGANKLKNLTINSSQSEPTQIGEGVELVNGIVGLGCHVFYGCKAVRFVLGNSSNLKYGARLINSFLGVNSTVSCCEMLNNLIFPAHEQHHNNSFLIASVVMGQSNLAAGATIGSNHNSRANDNEVRAGRGFWPGLCTSIKHSCRFASFVLLTKGQYPAEMDIPLPFSLLNNNTAADRLEVMPAYWWMHNMYALARNTWKFQTRDKRCTKTQNIEFDSLAPDTVEEVFNARRLLEVWVGKASAKVSGATDQFNDEVLLARIGRDLLHGPAENVAKLEVLGEGMEKSRRKQLVLHPYEGYNAYGRMLHYYAVKNMISYMTDTPEKTFDSMCMELAGPRLRDWENLGGQLVPVEDVDRLRADIGSGVLDSWIAIHERYDRLWEGYSRQKQQHAFATLCDLIDTDKLTRGQWLEALDEAAIIQEYIAEEVYNSRKKDYDNPFRRATFRCEEEMIATIGIIEDNGFVKQVREETRRFQRTVQQIKTKFQEK